MNRRFFLKSSATVWSAAAAAQLPLGPRAVIPDTPSVKVVTYTSPTKTLWLSHPKGIAKFKNGSFSTADPDIIKFMDDYLKKSESFFKDGGDA